MKITGRRITLKFNLLLFVLFFFLFNLTSQFRFISKKEDALKINLKWYKAYDTQDWNHVKVGILWSLSYLGADLPKGCFDDAIQFHDSTLFVLDFKKLGFNENAQKALVLICDSIKNTQDYQKNNFIDISRFLVLTLHSSYHYYQITGVAQKYEDFYRKYKLGDSYQFGVTKSAISKGHRIINFSKDTSLFNICFVATEGVGSLLNNTFKPLVYEVFDVMPNGQFRYAIYNEQGELTDAAIKKHSDAGKPSKCMWCHEINIQPLFTQNGEVENMMTNNDFLHFTSVMQSKLSSYRQGLHSEIDFNKKQDHTYSELLYISFMEPSLARLKQEFNNDTFAINTIRKTQSHIYNEFPFLGNLYDRDLLDKCFKYSKIKVPQSVREQSKYEPNFFK